MSDIKKIPKSKFQELQQLQQQQTRVQYFYQQEQRHYGACFILSRYQNGQPKYTLGPHYYVFIIALLALTALLMMLLISMKDHLTTLWFVALCIFGTVFFFSYLNIGLSVPGFASKVQQPTLQQKLNPRYCKPCKIIKNNNIYHCYDCDVCIQGYDHHCPWIGKCVGRQNLKAFYFFLIMTFGTLIMTFIATLASGASGSITSKNLRSDGSQGDYIVKG